MAFLALVMDEFMDQTIQDIIDTTPLCAATHTSIYDCIELMRHHSSSSLIITEDDRPIGLYTEADILRTLMCNVDYRNTCIQEIMNTPIVTASSLVSLFQATYLFTNNSIHHLIIIDSLGQLEGVISQTDIINHFAKENLMDIKSIQYAINKEIFTLGKTCSLVECISLMSDFNSDCAVAVDEMQKPVGIVTERDLASLIIKNTDINTLKISDIMSSPVVTININNSTLDAVNTLNKFKVTRTVVVDNSGSAIGILSQNDIMHSMEQDYMEFLQGTPSENNKSSQTQETPPAQRTQLENLLHSSLGMAIVATDIAFNIIYINHDASEIYQCSQANCIHKKISYLIKCDGLGNESLQIIKQQINHHGEYVLKHISYLNESAHHLETRITPIIDNDQITGYTIVSTDITEKLITDRQLRLASNVFESAIEGIIVTNQHGIIESVNPAFEKITGYKKDEAIGKTPNILHSDRQTNAFYIGMWRQLKTVGYWQGELWNRRKNGEVFPERLSISSVRDESGNITQFTAVFYDITDIKEQEEKINHRAYHDALTELPNRLLFKDRLGQAINRARRNESQLAVMFIDIDHFKRLNDTLGHQAGDEFLQKISIQFRGVLREQDTVSRFAGDEFTILLDDNTTPENALIVAQKLLSLFEKPFKIKGQEAHLGISIGIANYPCDGHSADDLIKNADTAMYHAKNSGRNNIKIFKTEMDMQIKQRATLESELRNALGNQELTIRYLPIIDLHTRTITSMEALLRWDNAGQSIPTDQFIPIAEKSGLIVPIGEWVLHQTCKQLSQWLVDDESGLTVSVNLSAREFREKELLSTIRRILDETNLNPQQLNLEITEASMMQDMKRSIKTLHQLKEMGVRILLDDFGIGYSSLTYLQKFPVDVLKLDHTFIHDIEDDAEAARLASGIIAMAKDLRLEVIAEGVETEGQLRFLEEHGCDKVQGYLFHKPLTEKELKKVLKKQRDKIDKKRK